MAAIAILKSLRKGDYLFREGEPSRGFYIVQQGTINVHRVGAGGKEQVIHVFRALESSHVLLMQKADILALLRRQPELGLRMIGSISQHLRALVGLLDDLTLKDVETRLANWLLKRCPQPVGTTPVRIELPMTKRVLAAELGTVSETFSRTLAKFREQGLLAVKGKAVTVISPARLAALLRKHLGE